MSFVRRTASQYRSFRNATQEKQRHQHLISFLSRRRPCRTGSTSSRYTIIPCRLQSTLAHAGEVPQRSLTARLFRSLFTATVFVSLGIYIGWETLPSRSVIAAILATAPSDAETLSAYQPPDPFSASVNDTIIRHPLALQLRKNSELVESRPHLKIPEPIRVTNLTGGTLAGPGRIVVPPLMFVDKEGKDLTTLFYLGEQLCGHPGIVHGGLLATLLDEGLARCCFPAMPNKIAVTANLKIDYRKPVRAGMYYVLRAKTTRVEGRKAWVQGWIELLEEGKAEGQGIKLVEAEALFIEPRNAKMIKRIYSTS